MIGGIETYLLKLSEVCAEMGLRPILYQWSKKAFERNYNGLRVKGVPVFHLAYQKRSWALFQRAVNELNLAEDILVFGSDGQSVKNKCPRTIAIQHGIGWDMPVKFMTDRNILQRKIVGGLYKAWLRKRYIAFFERCPNVVCVDYNFPNWYRTYLLSKPHVRYWVIPNFADIAPYEQIESRKKNRKKIKIIFSRRLCEYRGTLIMAAAAKRILTRYSHVFFTFAGEGPDKITLKEYFRNESRVNFIKYAAHESLKVHMGHDIAVVPSLASEGTSLSVAEAMGCGCAVVATAVGGITNMIVDGYNGLLISPEVDALVAALERLIESPESIATLGANAYQVAKTSFSLCQWKARWRQVFETMTTSGKKGLFTDPA